MANYYGTCRTNYFRVTDEERYKKLFSGLCAEDTIQDLTQEMDGIIYHGFGTYGGQPFWSDPDGEVEGDGFESFLDELQKILPENEAFIYLESGYEKLRYVVGAYIVVTSRCIESGEINSLAINAAKALLENDDFDTQTDY